MNTHPADSGLSAAAPAEDTDLLLAQHKQLHRDLDALWRCAGATPGPTVAESDAWRGELADRLSTLRRGLVDHFAHEDGGNAFADMMLKAPHVASKLERLSQEHVEMLIQLNDLLLDVSKAAPARLTQQTGVLIERLRRHEAEETAVILHVAYDDLGGAG